MNVESNSSSSLHGVKLSDAMVARGRLKVDDGKTHGCISDHMVSVKFPTLPHVLTQAPDADNTAAGSAAAEAVSVNPNSAPAAALPPAPKAPLGKTGIHSSTVSINTGNLQVKTAAAAAADVLPKHAKPLDQSSVVEINGVKTVIGYKPQGAVSSENIVNPFLKKIAESNMQKRRAAEEQKKREEEQLQRQKSAVQKSEAANAAWKGQNVMVNPYSSFAAASASASSAEAGGFGSQGNLGLGEKITAPGTSGTGNSGNFETDSGSGAGDSSSGAVNTTTNQYKYMRVNQPTQGQVVTVSRPPGVGQVTQPADPAPPPLIGSQPAKAAKPITKGTIVTVLAYPLLNRLLPITLNQLHKLFFRMQFLRIFRVLFITTMPNSTLQL